MDKESKIKEAYNYYRSTLNNPTCDEYRAFAAGYGAKEYEPNKQEIIKILEEIAKGEGVYSLDPLQNANNTIGNMKSLAEEALSKLQSQESPKEYSRPEHLEMATTAMKLYLNSILNQIPDEIHNELWNRLIEIISHSWRKQKKK